MELRHKIVTKQNGLELIQEKKREITEQSFNWKELGEKARKTLDIIAENDATALKNAYRELFEAILVRRSDSEGMRELKFVLRDDFSAETTSSVISAETFSIDENLG